MKFSIFFVNCKTCSKLTMFGITVFRSTLLPSLLLQFAGQMRAKSLLSFVLLDSWNQRCFLLLVALVKDFFRGQESVKWVWKNCSPSSLMLLVRLNYSTVSNDMFRRVLPECLIGICSRKKKKNTEVCFTSPYQTTKVTKDTIGPCSCRSLNIPSSSTNI